MALKVSFNDAYKEWRNRARVFNSESVVRAAMQLLHEPTENQLEELKQAPWQTLLLVKWVCQDNHVNQRSGRNISSSELYDLRQRLWKLPERLDLGTRDTFPAVLFFRRLIHSQVGFQRGMSPGFIREAVLLAKLPQDHQLRVLFEKKVGISVLEFIDLTLALYSAILEGKKQLDIGWFESLKPLYSTSAVNNFVSAVSRTFPELVEFFRALPDSKLKVSSEYFEFPVVSRYPFLRTGNTIECWHPAVFYRGMESYVHSVLSEDGKEDGKNYIDTFSKLFEQHVVGEAGKLGVPFIDEVELKAYLPNETKVPDGLLSFSECNIFIEAKAGLFAESVMTVGHSEIFMLKTKALRKAVTQAWSASVFLRNEKRAPQNVLNAKKDYLLIVTNRELSASRGTSLALMYPSGTLDYPNPEAATILPLEHIYVISIEDYERLLAGVVAGNIKLPLFLDECVAADQKAETAVHYFEQHLNSKKVPKKYSELVSAALEDAYSRVSRILEPGQLT